MSRGLGPLQKEILRYLLQDRLRWVAITEITHHIHEQRGSSDDWATLRRQVFRAVDALETRLLLENDDLLENEVNWARDGKRVRINDMFDYLMGRSDGS
jgi:hypothetical protein